jgi:predicted ATP-binding protein involved in virulence
VRIKNLHLKNIGPFIEANLDFSGDSQDTNSSVTIITGENGTGKTVILDAIRGLLFGHYEGLKRNIIKQENDFLADGNFEIPNRDNTISALNISSVKKDVNKSAFMTNQMQFNSKIGKLGNPNIGGDYWITNYWTSKTSDESLELKSLSALEPSKYLLGALNGIQPNIEVVKLICAFDYLRSSDNPKEKAEGEFLFNIIKKIIKLSLIDGEFKYVERKTLMPIVSQTGSDVSLDKLSSGNLYLIQRLISLLGQMYAVYALNNLALNDLCKTGGLLLIDEAENHLHPKWQKTFINSILDIFPNLQIIVTTHSPFIVSSVKNARVYVCESRKDYSIVTDETAEYANKPIEEILLSPVFNTNTFNSEITGLMEQRKEAIRSGNTETVDMLEAKLQEINPEYFSYLEVENLLESLSKQ